VGPPFCRRAGFRAKIYDALLIRCAAKCVERIYTFNLGDFKQLAPADLQEKIFRDMRSLWR